MLRSAGVLLLISLLAASERTAAQGDQGVQLLSLKFPGGTALAYVNAVRKAAGEFNVVIAPEATGVQMPAVNVRQVTVAAAIDLLDGRVRELPGQRIELEVTQMPVYDTRERQTYQVLAQVSGRHTMQSASVWTVANLLDNDIASEALLSAVETALEVVGSTTKPDVRFHEDTALLIASGDHDQLKAIEHVLDGLDESVDRRRQDMMRQVEMQLQEIDQDRKTAKKRLVETEIEVKDARQEALALRQEMARLELLTAGMQRMLEAKGRELAAALADLRALQFELQREQPHREPGRPSPGD
jgi:hypothetical protein